MINIKKTKFKLMIVGLAVAVAVIICSSQFAYGNNPNSDFWKSDNAVSVNSNQDDVSSQDVVSDTKDAQGEKVEASNKDEKSFGDYEDDCENQRKGQTQFLYDEVGGNYDDVYHVKKSNDGSANFNIITINRSGQEFHIPYDYRGYYGNRSWVPGRKANVQYFYNSETNVLNLVAFNKSDIGLDTMGYGIGYCGTNIFQDNIKYKDGTEYCIADHAFGLELDPQITGIKENSFQGLDKLEHVDIIGELYDECQISFVSKHSFDNCGNKKEAYKFVEMYFLSSAKLNAHGLVYDNKDWHIDTKIRYYENFLGSVYTPDYPTKKEFRNIYMLKRMLNKTFRGDKNIIVEFTKNFNFCAKTIDIPAGKEITFKLGDNMIYSYDNGSDTMFNVDGTLKLEGVDNLSRGVVQEVEGSNSNIVVNKGGKVNAKYINFTTDKDGDINNTANGGFFHFDDLTKSQSFQNCKFTGKAKNGGAIYIDDNDEDNVTMEMQECEFDNCYSTNKGGAIYIGDDSPLAYDILNISFKSCKFNQCKSKDDGGAIASIKNSEIVNFHDSEIDNCEAENGQGGAMICEARASHFNFYNTQINKCKAQDEGGAFAVIKGSANFNFDEKSVIDSCESKDNDGGAFYISANNIKIEGKGIIKNCTADGEGGAIYTSAKPGCGNEVTIDGITFEGNKISNKGSLQKGGGAICVRGNYNTIENCTFKKSEKGGSAIKVDDGPTFWTPHIFISIKNNNFYAPDVYNGFEVSFSDTITILKDSSGGNNIYYNKSVESYLDKMYDKHFKDAFCILHLI